MRWILPLLACAATAFGQVAPNSLGWVDKDAIIDYSFSAARPMECAAFKPITPTVVGSVVYSNSLLVVPPTSNAISNGTNLFSAYTYATGTNFTLLLSVKSPDETGVTGVFGGKATFYLYRYNGAPDLLYMRTADVDGTPVAFTFNDVWTRVAVTYAGRTRKLYYNGSLTNTATVAMGGAATDATNIGNSQPGWSTSTKAINYGDVKIINRTFTDAEIYNDYVTVKAHHPF